MNLLNTSAFQNCTKLSNIICKATTAPTLKSASLKNVASAGMLHVPKGSNYSVWQSTLGTGWTIVYDA